MEKYYPIRSGEDSLFLKPAQKISLTFDGTAMKEAERLYFTGESAIFYQWKDEPDYPQMYRLLDDRLNSEVALADSYCLDLSAENARYPMLAYYKMTFPPKVAYLPLNEYSDTWTLGISVKAENLQIFDDGYLRLRAEVRYQKDGVPKDSVKSEADEIFDLDIGQGTYDWMDLSSQIHFCAAKTASICFYLEGENYSGTLYAERPCFVSESGWNLLPSFAPTTPNRPKLTWFGVNLSEKEWPAFEIALNDRIIFKGKVFERCHMRSETELPLNGAEILSGENTLSFTLISDYHNPLSYRLGEVGMVGNDASFVVSCPKAVTVGKPFAVMVETTKNALVTLTSDSVRALDLTCENEGLNALVLVCDHAQNQLKFDLQYGEEIHRCTVEQAVIRAEDGVLTGTGDMIYIPNEPSAVRDYLKWYFENEIGNFLTIRPTYRWCGTRELKEDLWHQTAQLLNKAGMKYVHMTDGRELPGCDCNPSEKALMSENFLGRQNHELDGAFDYWGTRDLTRDEWEKRFYELLMRRSGTKWDYMGAWSGGNVNYFEKNGKTVLFRDPDVPDDMEKAAEYTVRQMSLCRENVPRHTGPSVMFKYFYQAGYEWTGAELMYGPQETTCAALRGASKAYGNPPFGAHHAVQWSTTPHDSDEKNLRYRLALFGSYLQGVSHINTEEGLWHIEEYYVGFNRFSEACRKHQAQQEDFYRYVQTHARTGSFYTPIAFLHGRFDGWSAFGRSHVWGKSSMAFAEPEKSWDVLRWFYPKNVMNHIYRHPCPNESQGYYSGTPYGNVDIIPIEQASYEAYPMLIAVGYNKALTEDFDKLEQYVKQGGRLVLGRAQCSETTERSDVVSLNHHYLDHAFRRVIAPDGAFVGDTYRGEAVTVGAVPEAAEILLRTDSGRALAYKLPFGNGSVVVMNVKEYAGNAAVEQAYRDLFAMLVPQVLSEESVYAEGDDSVQFAVYDQENGEKHIYFMATDWYRRTQTEKQGFVKVGQHRYAVPAPLANPIKVVVSDSVVAWCRDWKNDVLEICNGEVVVQGSGISRFTVAKDGRVAELTVDFSEQSVQKIALASLSLN